MMKTNILRFTVLVFLLSSLPSAINACSLSRGYFHQVTQLKGRVLGKSLGPLQFQWLRRMFSVADADVVLYNYNPPFPWDKRPAVARTKTNSAGYFELKNIKDGHYVLEISNGKLFDSFDVEVTEKAKRTKFISIDVSPITPACTRGHEFDVQTETR